MYTVCVCACVCVHECVCVCVCVCMRACARITLLVSSSLTCNMLHSRSATFCLISSTSVSCVGVVERERVKSCYTVPLNMTT